MKFQVLRRYRLAGIGSIDKSWFGCKKWRLSCGELWAATVMPDHWPLLSSKVCGVDLSNSHVWLLVVYLVLVSVLVILCFKSVTPVWVLVAASCGLLVLGLFRCAVSLCMNICISIMNEFQFGKKKKLNSNVLLYFTLHKYYF
ncbi:hypothetical protein N665_1149s0010 [Sinapis alba]|nr:hypothetical protein N665_1149s0010 [Sinapis alba]